MPERSFRNFNIFIRYNWLKCSIISSFVFQNASSWIIKNKKKLHFIFQWIKRKRADRLSHWQPKTCNFFIHSNMGNAIIISYSVFYFWGIIIKPNEKVTTDHSTYTQVYDSCFLFGYVSLCCSLARSLSLNFRFFFLLYLFIFMCA